MNKQKKQLMVKHVVKCTEAICYFNMLLTIISNFVRIICKKFKLHISY